MPEDELFLPEHLDGTSVSGLVTQLLERRGQPVEVNGERVKSAGALGLQVLVSATKQWNDDDQPFAVVSASEELVEASGVLGLSPTDLGLAAEQVVS